MARSVVDQSVFDGLKEMVGEDFIGELLDTFLEDAPQLLKTLEGALRSKDAEAFRRAAHSLKSNAASFGAKALSEQAKVLEALGREGKLDEAGDPLKGLAAEYAKVENALKKLRHEYP